MTTKHANADLLIGFANGRKLQFKDSNIPAGEREQWHDLEADNTEVWPWLLSTDPSERSKRFEFRLAPRTIMIGDVECEAPVTSFQPELWYCDGDGSPVSTSGFVRGFVELVIENRRAFASPEAAVAANNAITKLLTGQPN